MARISAQETTPGHTFSTADLMLSMTSNPRAEFLLGFAFFSPVKLDVSSNRIEPSHPCICDCLLQSWKNKRRREAPMRVSFDMADCTVDFTVERRFGQELKLCIGTPQYEDKQSQTDGCGLSVSGSSLFIMIPGEGSQLNMSRGYLARQVA
ncbi:hypothetical protein CR513_47686, partial [Mucuna pruriens]